MIGEGANPGTQYQYSLRYQWDRPPGLSKAFFRNLFGGNSAADYRSTVYPDMPKSAYAAIWSEHSILKLSTPSL